MNTFHILELIRKLESERDVHDEKFAGNEKHANCLPRFETTLAKLRDELAKLEKPDSEEK